MHSKDEALVALFAPRAVAVVGASPDDTKPGGRCLSFLNSFGYTGRLFAVNPKYSQVIGLPCYPALAAIPEQVDLVVLLVGAPQVPDYLRQAAAAGVRAVIVCASGFAEIGPAGAALQAEVKAIADQFNLAVLGPNSLGLVDISQGLVASFSVVFNQKTAAQSGPRVVLTQSGAIGCVLYAMAQAEGIGLGRFISTGNEAALDFGRCLTYLSVDPGASLILGYIEGLNDGRGFVAAARQARENGKTVALLKVGDSDAGRRAARAHTASTPGDAMVYAAAFRRAGVLPIRSISDLLDLAIALPGPFPVRGGRVGIVSMSGGGGVIMADRCTARGMTVPMLAQATRTALADVLPGYSGMSNPVDYGGVNDATPIERCLRIVAGDPQVDTLILFIGVSGFLSGTVEERVASVQAETQKRIFVAWPGGPAAGLHRLRALGVSAYDDPTRAADAAAQAWQSTLPLSSTRSPSPAEQAIALETQRRLADFAAANRTALVDLDLAALLRPYQISVVDNHADTSALQVGVGIHQDPQFGPTVTLALGRTIIAVDLAPLTQSDAQTILKSLPVQSPAALADLLVALGRLASDAGGQIKELRLHPIAGSAEGGHFSVGGAIAELASGNASD